MSARELSGSAVVVTGAGSGMGRAIARAFGALGAQVVVAERDEASGAATVESIRGAGGAAELVATDVAREADVERAVARGSSRAESGAGGVPPGVRKRSQPGGLRQPPREPV